MTNVNPKSIKIYTGQNIKKGVIQNVIILLTRVNDWVIHELIPTYSIDY